MNEFYRQRKNKKKLTREAIIGLGEDSFRKNYYPELQQKLLDLERINTRNKAIIMTIPDILLVSDLEGHITPFTMSLVNNNNPLTMVILRDKEIIEELREAIKEVAKKRELITRNFSIKDNKSTYYLEARIHISEIDEILIIVRDMTDRILLENRLREAAEKDGLTKLYNRHYFENVLAEYDGKLIEKLAIILIDIDGLKIVNDTLGHLAGDKIIVSIAKIIKEQFGEIGIVSRVGGDEYGVIIDGLTIKEIVKNLDEMKNLLKEYNSNTDTLKVTLSSGYSYHENGKVKIDFMYQESDNNMYQNKLLKESSNRNNLVKTLMKALEAKDYITEGHAERMEELATQIGEALSLAQNQIDRIQLLTKFHDIGKVGIPDNILKKPGKLNSDEWRVMKTHCSIGERIAAESSELKDISKLILKHHEKWDGSGYPLGLKENEIPIECRILSIVDTFDAMTNDRPYRKALSVQSAINEIRRCSGTQFDPGLVKIFENIISE